MVPLHLQCQLWRTVQHNTFEPLFDLARRFALVLFHRLDAMLGEQRHEHADELDLAELHTGTNSWPCRPRHERPFGRWFDVRCDGRCARRSGLINQPSRWIEGLGVRAPDSRIPVKAYSVDVDGCVFRKDISPVGGCVNDDIVFCVDFSGYVGKWWEQAHRFEL